MPEPNTRMRVQPSKRARLVDALREAVVQAGEGEVVVSIHLYGIRYARQLEGLSLKDLVGDAQIPDSYRTEIRKGMKLSEYVRIIGD